MKIGDYVKITKTAALPDAKVRSANSGEYKYGSGDNQLSLPVDYVLTGKLVTEVKQGSNVEVIRDTRNGIPCIGIFTTSIVTEVSDNYFKTQNSLYLIEKI